MRRTHARRRGAELNGGARARGRAGRRESRLHSLGRAGWCRRAVARGRPGGALCSMKAFGAAAPVHVLGSVVPCWAEVAHGRAGARRERAAVAFAALCNRTPAEIAQRAHHALAACLLAEVAFWARRAVRSATIHEKETPCTARQAATAPSGRELPSRTPRAAPTRRRAVVVCWATPTGRAPWLRCSASWTRGAHRRTAGAQVACRALAVAQRVSATADAEPARRTC